MNKSNIIKIAVIIIGLSAIIGGNLILYYEWLDNLLILIISSCKNKSPELHWSDKIQSLGIDLIITGFFIIIFQISFLLQRKNYLIIIFIFILVILWLPDVISGHKCEIENEIYYFLADDAMISMRYALNLASGFGLVWNPGEKVEGYSNFMDYLYGICPFISYSMFKNIINYFINKYCVGYYFNANHKKAY